MVSKPASGCRRSNRELVQGELRDVFRGIYRSSPRAFSSRSGNRPCDIWVGSRISSRLRTVVTNLADSVQRAYELRMEAKIKRSAAQQHDSEITDLSSCRAEAADRARPPSGAHFPPCRSSGDRIAGGQRRRSQSSDLSCAVARIDNGNSWAQKNRRGCWFDTALTSMSRDSNDFPVYFGKT